MTDKRNLLKYLALGDSYTIGEGVEPSDNFPNLLVKKLNAKGVPLVLDRIVAKTGWTSGEFIEAMEQMSWLEGKYFDCITLLIGVNNQYRGLSVQEYAKDFEYIAKKCLGWVRGRADRVIILSIPDWGVTPFAKDKLTDPKLVSKNIDVFNERKKNIALKSGFCFIEITEDYRRRGGMPQSLVSDHLHPSPFIYQHWANIVADILETKLQCP